MAHDHDFIEDVASRFALKRKPFVTLADALDRVTEKLQRYFGDNQIETCDLTLVDEGDEDDGRVTFPMVIGYSEEKFDKIARCISGKSSSSSCSFSEKEAIRICHGKCPCKNSESCTCSDIVNNAGRLEEKCVGIIRNWDHKYTKISDRSADSWAKLLAAIFQLIYSGKNILPGIAGRVYEKTDGMSQLGMSTIGEIEGMNKKSPVIIKLTEDKGTAGLYKIRVFDKIGNNITDKLAGDNESDSLNQTITEQQKHWSNHDLYKWVGLVQENPLKWQAYIPIEGLVSYRSYLAVPCKRQRVATNVIEKIQD